MCHKRRIGKQGFFFVKVAVAAATQAAVETAPMAVAAAMGVDLKIAGKHVV